MSWARGQVGRKTERQRESRERERGMAWPLHCVGCAGRPTTVCTKSSWTTMTMNPHRIHTSTSASCTMSWPCMPKHSLLPFSSTLAGWHGNRISPCVSSGAPPPTFPSTHTLPWHTTLTLIHHHLLATRFLVQSSITREEHSHTILSPSYHGFPE